MTPSKTEEPSRSRPARYSDMTDERMFSRYLLGEPAHSPGFLT